jgi:hypothetical protein
MLCRQLTKQVYSFLHRQGNLVSELVWSWRLNLRKALRAMPRILQPQSTSLKQLSFQINSSCSSISALAVLLQARDAIYSADAAASCLAPDDSEAHDCALADAEVLLSHAMRLPRHSLRLNLPKLLLQPCHASAFSRSVALRCSGTPVPYITRSRHFYNHEFFVTEDVLIPRPETEILVEHALQLAPSLPPSKESTFTFVDLGCGSGKPGPLLNALVASFPITFSRLHRSLIASRLAPDLARHRQRRLRCRPSYNAHQRQSPSQFHFRTRPFSVVSAAK